MKSGHAPINGLDMYYEIHGEGQPLVMLHGAFSNLEHMKTLLPAVEKNRQVILLEAQGHGRTADIDRPLSYEALADDVAAFIQHLGLEQVDLFGYSMGAATALQVALRHPALLRKLVLASVLYNTSGYYPGMLEGIQHITEEAFDGSPIEISYKELAPNPNDWGTLIRKIQALEALPLEWSPDAIRALTIPTLLIFPDSDVIRPEHAVELFRLLGGGIPGDMGEPLPPAQLAFLPGTSHVSLMDKVELLALIVPPFLDGAPAEA